jgi:hypothetical protein
MTKRKILNKTNMDYRLVVRLLKRGYNCHEVAEKSKIEYHWVLRVFSHYLKHWKKK